MASTLRRAALAATVLLVTCAKSEIPDFDQCTLDVALTPASGLPGDVIVATGGEFSADYDTVVVVDAIPAEVLDVAREDCAFCDGCRDAIDPPCPPCGICLPCEETCATCVQTVSFVVPEGAVGETSVVISNRWGTSAPTAFTVLEIDSADTSDTE